MGETRQFTRAASPGPGDITGYACMTGWISSWGALGYGERGGFKSSMTCDFAILLRSVHKIMRPFCWDVVANQLLEFWKDLLAFGFCVCWIYVRLH